MTQTAPMMPVGKQIDQDDAYNTLRRYRRQLSLMPANFRAFIVNSLAADLADETRPVIETPTLTPVHGTPDDPTDVL